VSPGTLVAPWRPLLAGAEREAALEIVRDIAAAVDDLSTRPPASDDPSLASGQAGLAVMFAYLEHAMPGESYGAAADRCLDRAARLVATTRTVPALHGGFAGVAWADSHVRHIRGSRTADRAAPIDELLRDYVARSPWRRDYDLIGGLVGFGVYALERLPRPAARECLAAVIHRLAELSERRDGGITWHTSPLLLPSYQRELCPDGYYNFGVAHGVPGVIGFLSAACAAGVATERAESMLRGAVEWMLARPQARAGDPGFPGWMTASGVDAAEAVPAEAARLAWCYGDLGIAATMLAAARCARESRWERAALGIAGRAAARPADRSGVMDAGLCHGAGGVSHVFNRLHQATGEAAFGDAARSWLARAGDLRLPSCGVAGYRAYLPLEGKEPWIDEPGFLTGAAGVALAFLAAATDIEPAWDRVLLLSAGQNAS
jgi:lantibiotic modifying enzyme